METIQEVLTEPTKFTTEKPEITDLPESKESSDVIVTNNGMKDINSVSTLTKDESLEETSNDCKKEETEQNTPDVESFIASNFLTAEKISEIMKEKGPTVKAVLLKVDGTMEEIDFDSTPSKCHIHKILNKTSKDISPTFVGQWIDIQVMIVKGRNVPKNVAINPHKLRFPFNNEIIRGPIFLYRVGDYGECQHFTVKEYKEFNSKSTEDIGKVWEINMTNEDEFPVNEVEYEDESCEDDDDDNDEDEFEDEYGDDEVLDMKQIETQVNSVLVRQFELNNGRKPTEEEQKLLANTVMERFFEKFGNLDGNENDDPTYNPQEEEDTEDETETENDDDVDEEEEKQDNETDDDDDEYETRLDNEFRIEVNEILINLKRLTKINCKRVKKVLNENYLKATGKECNEELFTECMKLLNINFPKDKVKNKLVTTNNDSFIVDDEEVEMPLSEDELRNHIAEAFRAVKKQGQIDGQHLAKMVSTQYEEVNGKEATVDDMKSIFDRLRHKLKNELNSNELLNSKQENMLKYTKSAMTQSMMNEARSEFFTKMNREPNLEELSDLILKLANEKFVKLDSNFESPKINKKISTASNNNETKIPVTTNNKEQQIKKSIAFFSPMRTKSSSKVNFKDLNKQFIQRSVKHFKNIHHRSPNEKEMKNLTAFLSTDKLPINDETNEPTKLDFEKETKVKTNDKNKDNNGEDDEEMELID